MSMTVSMHSFHAYTMMLLIVNDLPLVSLMTLTRCKGQFLEQFTPNLLSTSSHYHIPLKCHTLLPNSHVPISYLIFMSRFFPIIPIFTSLIAFTQPGTTSPHFTTLH